MADQTGLVGEIRQAATRLRDTKGCGKHTLDCDSRELLALVGVLLALREPAAVWLEGVADAYDGLVLTEHGPLHDELKHALMAARAVNRAAESAPGAVRDHLRAAFLLDEGAPT